MPTHAGAVVFRDTAEGREYLIIESSRGGEWVLPKGHLQDNETVEDAALREVQEEGAVTAKIAAPLGMITYRTAEEEVRAVFFLACVDKQIAPTEKRGVLWLPYEAARDLLTFDDTREMLRRAEHQRGPSP